MGRLADTAERLSRTQIFARLSPRRLRKLARRCVGQTFQRGDLIIEEGGVGLGMFVIVSGAVEVYRGEGAGRVPVARLGPGDLLGEVALVDELPRSASARARERTECLLLSREAFRALRHRDPEIAWCIVPTLTARLRSTQEALAAGEARGETIEFSVLGPVDSPPEPSQRESADRWTNRLVDGLERPVELGVLGARGAGAVARWTEDLFVSIRGDLGDEGTGSGGPDLRRSVGRVGRRLVVESFQLPGRLLRAVRPRRSEGRAEDGTHV